MARAKEEALRVVELKFDAQRLENRRQVAANAELDEAERGRLTRELARDLERKNDKEKAQAAADAALKLQTLRDAARDEAEAAKSLHDANEWSISVDGGGDAVAVCRCTHKVARANGFGGQ